MNRYSDGPEFGFLVLLLYENKPELFEEVADISCGHECYIVIPGLLVSPGKKTKQNTLLSIFSYKDIRTSLKKYSLTKSGHIDT